MKVQTFFIGLFASFGIAWVFVVAYPFLTLKDKEAVVWEDKDGNQHLYSPTGPNHSRGAEIYQSENCQSCHTQLIRPSSAGSEVFRDWAGMKYFDDEGNLIVDTRRESDARDYTDNYASIGSGRMGPDLINYGVRIKAQVDKANKANKELIESGEIEPFTAEELVYLHLYNPRQDTSKEEGFKNWSSCPSNRHMFDVVKDAGQPSLDALAVKTKAGYKVLPGTKAKHLAVYLTGMVHDQLLPETIAAGSNTAESQE